jgi:UDP-glucose 4-epimerase
MNVAVTGSHGYIGSVLCKELMIKGYKPVCCDIRGVVSHMFYEEIHTGSFDSIEFIDSIVDNNCKTIFHLAASSLLGPSATDPLTYYHNNTSRTINMIHMLRERGWKGRIVFSSTAAVYGDQGRAVSETDPLQPCNFYGASKLLCERIFDIIGMYGMEATIFRYFNVAGAFNDVGQDSGEPHIITRICNAAAGKAPLTVYGNNYPTRDNTCVRDYVHVRDICAAQIYAMENMISGTFNLGTKHGTTVKEIINAFITQNEVRFDYTMGDRREGDPVLLIANPKRFVDKGFQYRYSSIDQIVKSAWEYFNNGL